MTETPATRNPETIGATTSPSLRDSLAGQQVVIRESGLFPWWSLVGLGVISVLIGVVVLVWPEATLRVMAAMAGIWLVIGGLVRIFGAFVTGRGVGRQVLSGIVGVLLVLIGAACLRNLVTTVALLAAVVAVTWLLSCIAEAVMAAEASHGSRAMLLAAGLVSIAIGLVFLIVPRLSLVALVLMTGAGFVVTGLLQVVVGLRLRRADA
jgi:uncharacterized membrane protein HdeD (DUF308 family)